MRKTSTARTGSVTRWIRPRQSIEDLGLRIVAGRRTHRWPIPGAHRCVVEACDIDRDAGLAAVLLVTLPFRGPATAHQQVYEHDAEHGWVGSGGGSYRPAERAGKRARRDAARSGPAAVLEFRGSSGGISYLGRLRRSEAGGADQARMLAVSWINSAVLDTSAEVDHLLVDGRRIPAPDHGRCVIVWRTAPAKNAAGARRPRPHIAAVDRNGKVLSELGPDDVLDTFTQAFLDELT